MRTPTTIDRHSSTVRNYEHKSQGEKTLGTRNFYTIQWNIEINALRI